MLWYQKYRILQVLVKIVYMIKNTVGEKLMIKFGLRALNM